ncbi:MAG TPA: hypothetical protein VIA06_04420, partial [Candidatus Dormibacteraeota bacterium]|nr:hypothetical protein [Candidatus Dormibacteraeota bacterium]
ICLGVTTACHLAVLLASGAGRLFYLVDLQVSTLQFGLIPILLLTGSDFAEWGEVISAHAIDAVHDIARAWLLPTLAVAVALAVLVEAVWQSGAIRALGWGASAGIEFAIIVGLVRLIAKPLRKPEVPLGGMLLSGVILLVLALSTWAIGLNLTLIGLLWAPVVIAATVIGLLVKRWAGACVVVAVAGVTISIWLGPLPQGDMHGFQFVFALWSLVTIAWRAARGRRPLIGGIVGHQLVVLIVLQVLDFAFGWYGVGEDFGERLSLIAALLVLAAILWDVLMSGESVTNVEGRALPRHSRVMLYTGYAMLTAGTIAFFLAGPGTGTDFGIAHDFWERWSIYLVGLPAALLAFALAITRPGGAESQEPGDPIDRRVLRDEPASAPE